MQHLLDESVRVPGTPYHVGIDPIHGIVPVSGDFVTALASLSIVFKVVEVGVPVRHVVAMLARILVEFVVGSVPVPGTPVDAAWMDHPVARGRHWARASRARAQIHARGRLTRYPTS